MSVDLENSTSLEPRPNKKRDRIVGTWEYLAPECKNGNYSRASDIWGVGVIFYMLLEGYFPFEKPPVSGGKGTVEDWCTERFRSENPEASDLLLRFLDFNPNSRLSSAEEALKHRYFDVSFPYVPFERKSKN